MVIIFIRYCLVVDDTLVFRRFLALALHSIERNFFLIDLCTYMLLITVISNSAFHSKHII